jgi:hypothetical protein
VGAGSAAEGARGAGEPEESCPIDAGKRLKRLRQAKARENILNQMLNAESGGEKWVSDVARPRTESGWARRAA